MAYFEASGRRLAFEQDGARSDPTVLLLHGIGCQLNQWPPTLVAGLVAAGLRVVRLDHRDSGLSARCDDLGLPDLAALSAAAAGGGSPTAPPYTLQALAADAVALLDHLGQAGAHVIGLSMGGMVAQWMAITHPARLFSATLLMTSSGAPGLPPPAPEVAAAMLARPSGEDRAALLEHALRTCDLVGGPHYRSRDVGLGRFAAAALDRAYHPAGFVRQLAAIVADTDRAGRLAGIRVPTLVVHGDADPLLPLACGQDVAARIPGARLVVVPHMGHDLPEPLLPELLAHIRTHLAAVPLRR